MKGKNVNEQILNIQKELSASPEVVFDAWTTPGHMAQWFSPMTTATVPMLDLRVGGEYRIDMHGDDCDYVHEGKYLKVDRPRELAFTWISDGTQQEETIVTVHFEAKGEGTLLTLTHEKLPSDEARENHLKGWTVICDRLDGVLVSPASSKR